MATGAALVPWIELTTFGALVEAYAYARGEIKLDVKMTGELRYAPSFVPGKLTDKVKFPYTIESVGRFLGWMKKSGKAMNRVGHAVRALELIEEGLVSWNDFEGLTTSQAAAVVEETVRVREKNRAEAERAEKEARRAGLSAARQGASHCPAHPQRVRKHRQGHRRGGRAAGHGHGGGLDQQGALPGHVGPRSPGPGHG